MIVCYVVRQGKVRSQGLYYAGEGRWRAKFEKAYRWMDPHLAYQCANRGGRVVPKRPS